MLIGLEKSASNFEPVMNVQNSDDAINNCQRTLFERHAVWSTFLPNRGEKQKCFIFRKILPPCILGVWDNALRYKQIFLSQRKERSKESNLYSMRNRFATKPYLNGGGELFLILPSFFKRFFSNQLAIQ